MNVSDNYASVLFQRKAKKKKKVSNNKAFPHELKNIQGQFFFCWAKVHSCYSSQTLTRNNGDTLGLACFLKVMQMQRQAL